MFNRKYNDKGRRGLELLKSYKTEINLAEEQKQIINRTIGTFIIFILPIINSFMKKVKNL